jgi:hypothetical protein
MSHQSEADYLAGRDEYNARLARKADIERLRLMLQCELHLRSLKRHHPAGWQDISEAEARRVRIRSDIISDPPLPPSPIAAAAGRWVEETGPQRARGSPRICDCRPPLIPQIAHPLFWFRNRDGILGQFFRRNPALRSQLHLDSSIVK